jgi:hypothetical protein
VFGELTWDFIAGEEGFATDPQTLEAMFQSQIMGRYLKSAFDEGRVPFGGMSATQVRPTIL